jgi:hypothetical protein
LLGLYDNTINNTSHNYGESKQEFRDKIIKCVNKGEREREEIPASKSSTCKGKCRVY